jgi:PKD repeat protein
MALCVPRPRRALCVSAIALLAVSGLTAVPGLAQPQRATTFGDRSDGEEDEIREREEWFRETRGLDRTRRPDQARAAAVQQLRSARQARAVALAAAGETWSSLGPLSIKMLNWAMGPVTGRVAALAVHPADERIVYLGAASGGAWKTTDGGSQWAPLFDDVGTMTIGAIAIHPANPNHVWVGTGEQGQSCTSYFGLGVFRSTDGGSAFTPRNGGSSSARRAEPSSLSVDGSLRDSSSLTLSHIASIALHPTSLSTLLVSGAGACQPDGTRASGGVYRTTDGGATWTRVLVGTGSDVFYDPGNLSVVYAALNNEGIRRSTDGGVTWTPASAGLPGALGRTRLVMAPSDSRVLYALSATTRDLYRTADGGASWAMVKNDACEGQCNYDLTLDVDPANASRLLVGSIKFGLSTDGGATINPLINGWGGSQKVHQDIHVVRFSRGNSNRFWVGGDGGLWRSDDGGGTYINLNANLTLTQLYDVAIDPHDPTRIFGGAQDNSSMARVGSLQWNVTAVTGDGFMNLVDPADANRVFQTSYPGGGPNLIRSTTGGAPGTFTNIAKQGITTSEPFPWVTPLAITSGTVFVGSHSVYRGASDQPAGSFTWTKISPSLTGDNTKSISAIGVHRRGDSSGAYVGTSTGRIHRTDDVLASSVSWTDVTGNYPGGHVSDVAVDPGNPQRVYVTRGGFGVSPFYRSTSGGTTWTSAGSGLPNVPANAVAVDPLNSARVFVGTDVGVYESADGGDNFQPFSAGLPLGLVVTDLEIDDAPHVLVAGTYGRGAFRVNLAGGENQRPIADFDLTSNGLSIAFQDTSHDTDGAIASHNWSFGDGTTSTAANPTRTYAAAGIYSVSLTVTDDRGATGSVTQPVAVGVTGTNLALGATATSSAPCGANEGPEKAINGSVSGGNGDKWCSFADSKFLQLDLGGTFQIFRFVVKHAGAGGESLDFNTAGFEIQVSPDGSHFSTVVSISDNRDNITTHPISPVSARHVRLNITMAMQNIDFVARIYELEVYGVPVTSASNLALGKPATGSTPCNANEAAAKAFNGSVSGGNGDKWCTQATPKHLQVDLGSSLTVGRFVVKHAGAGGESASFDTRAFNLQVSPDGTTFTTVVSVTANTDGISTHTITPRTARYVRLEVVGATQSGGGAARIYELEVYGP